MAANTNPIYVLVPDPEVGGAVIGTTANTATDGTGSAMYKIFTAGVDGSFVSLVRFKSISTVAATVIRLWYCTDTGTFVAGTTNTAANTTMIGEVGTAAWTASNVAASPTYEIAVGFPIPADTKLLVSFGTSTGAATTGFNPLTIAGNY